MDKPGSWFLHQWNIDRKWINIGFLNLNFRESISVTLPVTNTDLWQLQYESSEIFIDQRKFCLGSSGISQYLVYIFTCSKSNFGQVIYHQRLTYSKSAFSKHKKKVGYFFNVINKDTKTTSLTSLTFSLLIMNTV